MASLNLSFSIQHLKKDCWYMRPDTTLTNTNWLSSFPLYALHVKVGDCIVSMLQYAQALTWVVQSTTKHDLMLLIVLMCELFWPNLLAVLKFRFVSIKIMFKLFFFFLVLVLSNWWARYSTICMKDYFFFHFLSFFFKLSTICYRWVIKCFTQCMVLYCILC